MQWSFLPREAIKVTPIVAFRNTDGSIVIIGQNNGPARTVEIR